MVASILQILANAASNVFYDKVSDPKILKDMKWRIMN
jgi:hypothetical protein